MKPIVWEKESVIGKPIYTRLTKEHAEKVEKIAQENGMKESSVVRRIVEYYFEEVGKETPKPKLYEMEFEAHQFMKGWHSLKEWANFGFNKVVFEDRSFWDGLENGSDDFTDIDDLEMDEYDFDEDGYVFITLRKGEK